MDITSPELKNIIYQVVFMEPAEDALGIPVQRKVFPIKYQRGVKEIRKEILSSLEMLFVPKGIAKENLKPEELVWNKVEGYVADEVTEPFQENGKMSQRFNSDVKSLSDRGVDTLKFYLKEWKDCLPELSEDTLSIIERLL